MFNMKAIKVKIYPSKQQEVLLEKHFGCCRFIYNFGLERKIKSYAETKKSISIYEIDKELTKIKEEKEWLREVNSQSLQQSLKDLESAFSHFFKKNNAFPKFKSKCSDRQSFRVPQGFDVSRDSKALKLPKLRWIKFKDEFNVDINANFRNITISREDNNYFASICYEEPDKIVVQQPIVPDKTLGIDLGIKDLVVFSNGQKISNPRHLKQYEEKLAVEQAKLSKQVRGSSSHKKQRSIVNKIHKKVRNTRKDSLHKLTTKIVKNQDYSSFAMEDLAVNNMVKNHYLAKAITDCGRSMLKQMMEYKTKDCGKNLLVIGRFEPSSKTCCTCGNVQELSLNDRTWTCRICNTAHDRDINAANNIKNFALIKSLGKGFAEMLEPHRF